MIERIDVQLRQFYLKRLMRFVRLRNEQEAWSLMGGVLDYLVDITLQDCIDQGAAGAAADILSLLETKR